MHLCMSGCTYAHVNKGAHKGQRHQIPVDLEYREL